MSVLDPLYDEMSLSHQVLAYGIKITVELGLGSGLNIK